MKKNLELLETRDYNDISFPMVLYFIDLVDDGFSVPLHWHNEFEIVYVEEGCSKFQINLKNYDVCEGDIVLIPSDELHSCRSAKGLCKIITIIFSLDILRSFTALDACSVKYVMPVLMGNITTEYIIKKEHACYEALKNSLLEIYNTFPKINIGFELETKSLLYRILAILYKNNMISTTKKEISNQHKYSDKIKEVMLYIEKNFNTPIKISDIAKSVNYSEWYLSHFFKEKTGITCSEYINICRLNNAAQLLVSSDTPVMEIALDTGFQNFSYFSKVFKKRYNMTPQKYRKENYSPITQKNATISLT